MMTTSALVLVILLCAALALGAWAGLFGVHARSTARRLLRGGRARRREREMIAAMRIKIAAAEPVRAGRAEGR